MNGNPAYNSCRIKMACIIFGAAALFLFSGGRKCQKGYKLRRYPQEMTNAGIGKIRLSGDDAVAVPDRIYRSRAEERS